MSRYLLIALTSLAMACSSVQEFQSGVGSDAGPPPPAGGADCEKSSDPDNCGACGHRCLGGVCSAGQCSPVVLATDQGDSAYGVPWYPYTTDAGDSLEGPDRLAVDDTHVYWLNLRGEVMRVPLSGGDAQRVARTDAGPAWIALDEQFVYFSTFAGDLFRVAKGGGTPVRLAAHPVPSFAATSLFNGPYPYEFLLSAGKIYFASGAGIHACPVTGCADAPEIVDEGTADRRPFSFAIDTSGRMYASEEIQQPGQVAYAMTVFREGQWLGLASPTAYYELHGGAGEVFAISKTDFGVTGVVRWSEKTLTILASGEQLTGSPRGLTLDEDHVYWANAAPGRINRAERIASVVRCKKTGCASPEVLVEAQLVPRAVATSNEAVYWTTGDGKVMKLAKPAGSQRPLQ